jgi:tetratricopeptide (TPR) repeat protein
MVGDAYAAQGFTVKGIAMYKKIAKLQPSVDGTLKLAELYTQQGLFNDARAQYLQVAEDFMKNGDLDQAIRLFQKVLEMDPENVPMRIKLAEVYIRRGKKKEAWEIFCSACWCSSPAIVTFCCCVDAPRLRAEMPRRQLNTWKKRPISIRIPRACATY